MTPVDAFQLLGIVLKAAFHGVEGIANGDLDVFVTLGFFGVPALWGSFI